MFIPETAKEMQPTPVQILFSLYHEFKKNKIK